LSYARHSPTSLPPRPVKRPPRAKAGGLGGGRAFATIARMTRITLALSFLVVASCGEKGSTKVMVRRMEDWNRFRQLAELIVVADPAPFKDGTLDPYAFVKTGGVKKGDYDLFRSATLTKGPTDAQIESGDYTNFPWERYRGDPSGIKGFPSVPLLWEKEPGAKGRLVAWSDGSCRFTSPEEFNAATKR